MDKWLPAHRAADGANGPYVMGYHRNTVTPVFRISDPKR